MSSINFDNIWLLFIALPLVVLFVVPFAIAVKKDNVNGHNVASMVLHIIMAALIAFAAAGTQLVTVITETDVYVVADVSYSANKNLDTVDGYIKNLTLPRNSKLGVICFGKDYQLLSDLGQPVRSVKEAGVDDTETNITEALEYAGTLFKDGVIKRIVLITDGKDSYPEDSNKLKRTVDGLVAKNIKVDAIYLDDNLTSDSKEVQISNAEYTKNAYLDHPETVNVYVQTNYATSANVTLYKNGAILGGTKTERLTLGSNNIRFSLDTFEAGTFDYRVAIEAENDECRFNNTYSFTQTVSEIVDVLLIASKQSDLDYVKGLYGKNTQIESYINDPEVPVSVEDLAKFDQIIISDTDVTLLNNYELFLQSVDSVVSQFGKSLLTFGDLGIQASGENDISTLDDMLPVRYGSAAGAPKLYSIAIDVSHSMNAGWSRFRLAKLAAIQLVNNLNDDDYLRLITFSGEAKSIFFGRVGPSRDNLITEISGLTTEQGTYMGLGLQQVMEYIKDSDFSQKQVMLITDGLPFNGIINYGGAEYAGMTDKQVADSVVQTMLLYGIHTSVLQVGGSSAEGGGGLADTDWLKSLAFKGGGTHYLAENEVQLNSVIFGDIKEDEKPEVTDTWINPVRPRDPSLNDVNTTLSYVSDYTIGKVKSSATEVLSIKYQVGKVTADVPLYAYWNYGNGMVASYSGKINEIKKRDQSNINDAFFGNVLENLMPAEKVDYPYALKTDIDGKTAKITLTPAEIRSKATARITFTKPDGEETTDLFVFNSSEYIYEIAADEIGKYTVDVVYSYNGSDYAAGATFNLSYEPEYDAFTVYEASVIYKMIGSNGTVSEDGTLSLENDDREIATYTIRLTVPLLVIAVVLYVVDIAIRKLKWKDITSLFGMARRNKNVSSLDKDGGKK